MEAPHVPLVFADGHHAEDPEHTTCRTDPIHRSSGTICEEDIAFGQVSEVVTSGSGTRIESLVATGYVQ